MNSRIWKSLVLAPLSLTVLVACSGRDKTPEPTSPFAGTWLRQSAWIAYNESDATSFCPRVYQRPQDHGINTQSGAISDVAWRVDNGGQVYHWTPSIRFDHPSAKSYVIGSVGANGNFALQAPVPGRNAYQYQARANNPYSRVVSVDSGRLNFARWDGRVERYVRVSEAELQSYASRLSDCGSNLKFSDYGYDSSVGDYSGQSFQQSESPYVQSGPNGPSSVVPNDGGGAVLPNGPNNGRSGNPYQNGNPFNEQQLPPLPVR